jgi:DNA-binding NtrC family response regulator
VLLEGETGTGKGLVARALHEESRRAASPFVLVLCSAVPRELLESEMFGHERGSFTGAGARKPGLVEVARRGTLFLDEIGDLPRALQAKLLGLLEDWTFRPVGATEDLAADVRVVAATLHDLRLRTDRRQFRRDLFYRVSMIRIAIPPLRERREDIPLLAESFREEIAAEWGRPSLPMTSAALECLAERPWPGNVRELRGAVRRAVILCEGDALRPADFAGQGEGEVRRQHEFLLPRGGLRLHDTVDDLVRQALARCHGSQSAAARLLGVGRDFVRYRVKGGRGLGTRSPESSADARPERIRIP